MNNLKVALDINAVVVIYGFNRQKRSGIEKNAEFGQFVELMIAGVTVRKRAKN